jgi:hypothetical protein
VVEYATAKKNGLTIDEFRTLKKMDLGKMDKFEKVVQHYKMQYPDESEQGLREQLAEQLKYDPENPNATNLLLTGAAKEAEKYFGDLKGKLVPQDTSKSVEAFKAEQVKVKEANIATWKQAVPSLVESFKDGVPLYDSAGKEIEKIPLTEPMKKQLADFSKNFIESLNENPIEANEKTGEQIYGSIYSNLITRNIEDLRKYWHDQGREEEIKKNSSASGKKNTDKEANINKEQSDRKKQSEDWLRTH